VYLIKNKNK